MARKSGSVRNAGSRSADEKAIQTAAGLLNDIKNGKITAYAVAYVTPAEPYTGSTSACSNLRDAKLLEGAIAELRHEFAHAMSNRR